MIVSKFDDGFDPVFQNLILTSWIKKHLTENVPEEAPTEQLATDSKSYFGDWYSGLVIEKGRQLDSFLSKQKFEGTIISIKDDTFVAKLTNLTEETPDEEAEFSINEISDDDLPLLALGAVFYWNIGYMITRGGRKHACQILYFRRLPIRSKLEIKEARMRVEKLLRWLDDEDTES
ncbi:hypothetical protein [Desulfofustis glycolicus]|uniref:hypothetical protein n=1 Tax=Desulfofustis glycolicus TaxID=51195 RepID=UPI001161427C|nr:hypothetical protein [Desulfofustis glycolicus]